MYANSFKLANGGLETGLRVAIKNLRPWNWLPAALVPPNTPT